MRIPLSYSARNIWTRRLTSALTAGGMALVVFVFAAILMLAAGLRQTLVSTGSPDNVLVARKGSQSEIQSSIERSQASILDTLPQIALDRDGVPLLAKEIVVLISLPKRGVNTLSNVVVRGIGDKSLQLRPQVRLVQGRMPKPGSTEIVAGMKVAERFKGAGIGESIRFGQRDWNVVGLFDAGATGFSSEIWGDGELLMQSFRRQAYSLVLFKLADASSFETVRDRIGGDPRLSLEAKRETRFYEEQSEVMAKFLRVLGLSLTIIFSLGAIIGAMITMYSAVAGRVGEIGTLRALGFSRRDILAAFIVESLLLGALGGGTGLFFASFLQLLTISTMNFQTFSELAFSFTLTPAIVWQSMAFALGMGFLGGILPAFRASRLRIVDALRSA